MIIVKISGGLGNQLFQYAFGKYLSKKFNSELKFDVQTNYNFSGFTHRSFALGDLNLKIDLASQSEIKKFKHFVRTEFLSRIERKLVQKMPFLNRNYVVQSSNNYQKNKNNIRDNCYYDGYWQSEKYFKPIENELRNDLKLLSKLNIENIKLLGNINNSESISIHIRRSDYIKVRANTRIFAICSIEYYRKAIDFFINKLNNPIFYIFSDDIDWAKENFEGGQFRFVDFNTDSPVIDMFLMSRCKNNIIANSSFSWWGAWFNSNPTKIVVAPKYWFHGYLNKTAIDIVPANWIRI